MLIKLSILIINFYQQYISPHKGYCCAYRVDTGEYSCSQYAKVSIEEHGLFAAVPYIREQFDRCNFSAERLKDKHKKKSKDDGKIYDECIPSCDAFSTCHDIGNCHPFH